MIASRVEYGIPERATSILELIPVAACVDEAQDVSERTGTSGSEVWNVVPWGTFSSNNMKVMMKCTRCWQFHWSGV